MTNSIFLTLGQAAKETGISKPSLSAAIKKGRFSAEKQENGQYKIDPAELFRVYPRVELGGKANREANPNNLTMTNSKANTNKSVEQGGKALENLSVSLLLEEKDKSIKRLEEENARLVKQTNTVTRLIEDHSKKADKWESIIVEQQSNAANNEIDRIKKIATKRIKRLEEELQAEKKKSFLQRLFR